MTPEVRCAFYGRVSTEDNQDPTLSLPRQLANCEQALGRIGGRIVAHYYDVESGASALDSRGSGRGLRGFEIPIPRDGGLLDLLQDSRSGTFQVVIAESISRFSRNPSVTFRAEEELLDAGVRLWATDEPWEESFGSIVLRHVNVGLARGFLHELKVKSRQGIETAARQGRHAGGAALYGYRFRELPHPNPHRASQGRKMRVLEPDPVRAPIVRMIFEDYVVHGLSYPQICEKLNADIERFPPPESPDPARRTGLWGRSSIWEILHNPKYTGYQVWNRRARKRGGRVNPPNGWIWSEEPAHEALVAREIFEQAVRQGIRNSNGAKRPSAEQPKAFLLRSFVRCSLCGLRMVGNRRRGVHYYLCEARRRPVTLVADDHPRTVYIREDVLAARVVDFLRERVFGPDRVPLIKTSLESADPEHEAREGEVERIRRELRDLTERVRRQVANLEAEEPGTPAANAIRHRLNELAALKARRERDLAAADQMLVGRSDPEAAAVLLEALPRLDVKVDTLAEEDFRQLLDALKFEARYDPGSKQLTIRILLVPELLLPPEGGPDCSRVKFVPPTGFEPVSPP